MYARALKVIREYHRLSQTELADRLGLSKSYISELEAGSKKASLDVLERYAEHFQIPMSSLMLFAERSANADFGERTRSFAANKVLKMLEWLSKAGDDPGKGRSGDETVVDPAVLPIRDRIAQGPGAASVDEALPGYARGARIAGW